MDEVQHVAGESAQAVELDYNQFVTSPQEVQKARSLVTTIPESDLVCQRTRDWR